MCAISHSIRRTAPNLHAMEATLATAIGNRKGRAMRYLKCLSVTATLLAFCVGAHAGNNVPERVAQTPNKTPTPYTASCQSLDVSTLTGQSDYSAFMKADCPDSVRRDAFHKLWRTLPTTNEPGESDY
jgi:hypothetical protein